MIRKLLLFLCLPFYVSLLPAQDMERVHRYLDTLCAPRLNGRGAVLDGQKKAAVYLADRLSEAGISPLGDSYFQEFLYDINTFPGQIILKTDQVELRPGVDYIVNASSPSGKAAVKVILLDTLLFSSPKKKKRFFHSNFKNCAIVYDEKFVRLLKGKSPEFLTKIKEATCIVELKEKKLTMGLSSIQSAQPVFEVLKEKFNTKTKILSFEIEASLLKNYKAQNVCGIVKGIEVPDSVILLTAHYDHLGRLGTGAYFPGANDNGSGVSMLLELTHYYKQNPQRYSMVFVFFGAEEAGLIGSKYFTENPLVPLSKIRFMINMDLMGTGDDGMMVVNGTVFPKELEMLITINTEKVYLAAIKKRGKAANSDHYFFTEKGVPAFFLYTLGGIAAYHDVHDVPQTLPLTKFREVFRLINEFIPQLINSPR